MPKIKNKYVINSKKHTRHKIVFDLLIISSLGKFEHSGKKATKRTLSNFVYAISVIFLKDVNISEESIKTDIF